MSLCYFMASSQYKERSDADSSGHVGPKPGLGHSPTSVLQRKISRCIYVCTACHNNASFLSAICNFQIGEKRHGKDEG